MTKIYYFSGTGNSLWSAKKIAAIIGGECEIFNIGVEAQKSEIILEADAIIFVSPAYAYGLPLLVRSFAKRAVFRTPYVATLVTYGTSPGGAPAQMSRVLKEKNIDSVFFCRIPAVENFLAIFGPQNAATIAKRTAMQKEATEKATRCIIERQTSKVFTFRPFSSFVSLLFSLGVKIFYKLFRISNDCIGCGICEKICPVSAVVVRDKRPVFSGKCEQCHGCINQCPQRAIHFFRANSKTPCYRHPEIGIDELSGKRFNYS